MFKFFLLVFICLFLVGCIGAFDNSNSLSNPSETLKVGTFNTKTFGESKWSRFSDFYVELVQDYDILFLQEIREADGDSFRELCSLLQQNYDCNISSRAGSSPIYQEQYGVIYRNNVEIKEFKDYNPNYSNFWERPPIEVKFQYKDYVFTAWNIHVDPDVVNLEMKNLEEFVKDLGNVMVLGDLNLDCKYDDGSNGNFENWNYVIKDEDDTTTSTTTNCAYDRIILNDNMSEEYVKHNIDKTITTESDHYPIWVEIRTSD